MAAEHTGAMIALVPAEADAQRLAMDGGEPVEELHLTLAYLGNAVDWDQRERFLLASEVAKAVEGRPPYEGNVFHVAYFNPGGEEPALVYGIGGEEVERAHSVIAMVAGDTFGPKIPDQHRPWVAHMTVAYGNVFPYEGRDIGASFAAGGSSGSGTYDKGAVGLPGVAADAVEGQTMGLDTGSERECDPGGDGSTPGAPDPANRGRAPHVSQYQVRGAHTSDCPSGFGARGTSRGGAAPGAVLGAPGAL